MSFRINYRNCTSCRLCYDHCPADVITWDRENSIPYMKYTQECWHCGVCWMECQDNAIIPVLPPQCLSERNPRFLSLPVGLELREDNIGMI